MADFVSAATATVKMPVNITAAGNIAQSGDTVAGKKVVSIPGIKQAATLTEANTVFSKIYGVIGGGTYDSLSAQKITTQGVTTDG